MPLRASMLRVLHRPLYGGKLQKVTLLKRGNDMQEIQMVRHVLFQCYKSAVVKTGEQISQDMSSEVRTVWLLPRVELDRIGVNYINNLDIIIDKFNRWWQPEATTQITEKLLGQFIEIQCLRIDPPGNVVVKTG